MFRFRDPDLRRILEEDMVETRRYYAALAIQTRIRRWIQSRGDIVLL